MKVIFICRTGRHLSLFAGYVLLRKLNWDMAKSDLSKLKGFRDYNPKEVGRPFYVGSSKNMDVFSIGVGSNGALFEKVVSDFFRIMDPNAEEIKIVNLSEYVTMHTLFGNFLYRIGFSGLGNYFMQIGLQEEVQKIKKVDEIL